MPNTPQTTDQSTTSIGAIPAQPPLISPEDLDQTFHHCLLCEDCETCLIVNGFRHHIRVVGTSYGRSWVGRDNLVNEGEDEETSYDGDFTYTCGDCHGDTEVDADHIQEIYQLIIEKADAAGLNRQILRTYDFDGHGFSYQESNNIILYKSGNYYYHPLIVPIIKQAIENDEFPADENINWEHSEYQLLYSAVLEQNTRRAAAEATENAEANHQTLHSYQGATIRMAAGFNTFSYDTAMEPALSVEEMEEVLQATVRERDPMSSPIIAPQQHRRWMRQDLTDLTECTNPKCNYTFEVDPAYDTAICPQCKTEINTAHET